MDIFACDDCFLLAEDVCRDVIWPFENLIQSLNVLNRFLASVVSKALQRCIAGCARSKTQEVIGLRSDCSSSSCFYSIFWESSKERSRARAICRKGLVHCCDCRSGKYPARAQESNETTSRLRCVSGTSACGDIKQRFMVPCLALLLARHSHGISTSRS